MPKYRLTPAISLARNYNTVGVSEAPTYNAAVVKVGGYTLVRSIINGSAVFPMDDLFEIIAQDGNAQTTISLEVDGQAIASSPLYLLKGASVRAMTNNAQADTPISWPQPSKIVVFPAPFSPNSPTICPCGMVSDTSDRASLSRYFFVT